MHHHAITRDREVSKADIPMYDMLSGQGAYLCPAV